MPDEHTPEVRPRAPLRGLQLLLAHAVPFVVLAACLAATNRTGAALVALGIGAAWVVAVLLRHHARLLREIDATRREARTWEEEATTLGKIFEVLPAAVMASDPDGNLLVYNQASERMLGIGALGAPISEWATLYGIYRPDQVTPYRSDELPFVRAIRGETVDTPDIFVRNQKREGIWISAQARPVCNEAGEVIVGVLLCNDITERREVEAEVRRLNADLETRVEQRTASLATALERLEGEVRQRERMAAALRESRKLLEGIVDNAPAIIFIKNLEGRYLMVSPQWERELRMRAEDVVGHYDTELFPADIVPELRANDERVLLAGMPLEFEELVNTPKGMRTFLSLKFPLRDANGHPYAVCGIATDISERKQMEAELRRSRASLTAVLDSTDDAVWSVDRQYRVVIANAALRELYTALYSGDVHDMAPPYENFSEEFQTTWRALYDRALAGERLTTEQHADVDGVERHYLISMSPIREEGEITGATVFSRDITAVRAAQELARRNQAELTHVLRLGTMGEIAAALAHEINQPLGAISNFAGACLRLLDSGNVALEELHRGFERIGAEALRAGEIIRRLRSLGRKGDGEIEVIDLNAVVQRAADLMQAELRLQDITLEVDVGRRLPPVYADAIQIEQVLLNLFLNAIESMQSSAEREIRVHTGADNGNIAVTIRDSGSGFPSEVAERVFEPFFTTKEKGLGMGLAISRRIIEAHGGRLWGSANGGGGSTFVFTLPALPA